MASRWIGLGSANHGSIGDSRPMALWGYARGPRVPSRPARERARAVEQINGDSPSNPLPLARVGRTAKIQSRTVAPRLFGLRCHLRCQMMGVEPFSFLPQEPSEAGDLACQGEACQVRPHALVEALLIKRVQGTGRPGGDQGGARKDFLQLAVVLGVKTPDARRPEIFKGAALVATRRSEEHKSELQSR